MGAENERWLNLATEMLHATPEQLAAYMRRHFVFREEHEALVTQLKSKLSWHEEMLRAQAIEYGAAQADGSPEGGDDLSAPSRSDDSPVLSEAKDAPDPSLTCPIDRRLK